MRLRRLLALPLLTPALVGCLGGSDGALDPSATDGVLASGREGAVPDGPLMDGDFTTDEVKRLLLATSEPRPGNGEDDAASCNPQAGGVGTLPAAWNTVPEGVPQYYFIGYGAVTPDTLGHAKRVLRGEEPMPERPVEDAFFALDQEGREALVEVDP